jgi:serine/threonine-protein kinase RsbW
LSFPAKPDYLLLARLALSGLARQVRMSDEVLADLKLAVTEACGNAVRHAYQGEAGGDVSVSYVVAKDVLEIVVEDQGTGMEVEEQDISDGPVAIPVESGMGLAIIRTIVDDLEIRPGADDRGTVVRMSKRLVSAES